jgi:hypothetical protein
MYLQATVEAILNSDHPIIGPNSLGDDHIHDNSPLNLLATCYRSTFLTYFQAIDKFHLLLKRGADVKLRDKNGSTCLHLLAYDKLRRFLTYDENEFKSILVAMISAGADVRAINKYGLSVSDIACEHDHEEIWIEVLVTCGYDPWNVFSVGNNFFRPFPGMHVFSTAEVIPRAIKLRLEEYYSRKEFFDNAELSTERGENWKLRSKAEVLAICGDDDSATDSYYCSDGYSDKQSVESDDDRMIDDLETEGDGYSDRYESVDTRGENEHPEGDYQA